ncbi:orotidine-5'-phosphate decarboxylase [Microvirga pudoricolor]|uniref:orotidine-5'-phosphate decarboxylase n=1 Tax=Microvirga pudoricolor TaxID=2778729 RepID=UPI001E3E1868|nr:orotidine-5'-phosphate decarboxylase [Microvirga pudoricolor]
MGDMRDRLIIGLDLPTVEQAREAVSRIGDAGTFYKVGYQLGYAPGGFDFVKELVDGGKKVFFDLKLHDIGNTVEAGARAISRLGVTLLTVHAYPQTMRAAMAGKAGSSLKILAVTVLTSYDEADLVEAGYAAGSPAALVARRAAQGRDIGVDGIVCAATEAADVKAILGPDRLIVTPGIRPAGAEAGDQKRIVTPAEALRLGATHLVVARPIVGAADPRRAAEAIVDEMAGVS